MQNEKVAEKLFIEFSSEDRGFIFFTITIGDKVLKSRFSDVFDPIPDLKSWLEAIAVEVEECAFTYATEGEDPKFNFHRWGRGRPCKFFEGYSEYGENERGIMAYVDRHQFVHAFYTTFLNFITADTFKNTDWDSEMRGKFKSKIVEEYLKSNAE